MSPEVKSNLDVGKLTFLTRFQSGQEPPDNMLDNVGRKIRFWAVLYPCQKCQVWPTTFIDDPKI